MSRMGFPSLGGVGSACFAVDDYSRHFTSDFEFKWKRHNHKQSWMILQFREVLIMGSRSTNHIEKNSLSRLFAICRKQVVFIFPYAVLFNEYPFGSMLANHYWTEVVLPN